MNMKVLVSMKDRVCLLRVNRVKHRCSDTMNYFNLPVLYSVCKYKTSVLYNPGTEFSFTYAPVVSDQSWIHGLLDK